MPNASLIELRIEERDALSAIFGDDYSGDDAGVSIRLEDHGLYGSRVFLKVLYGNDYPDELPKLEIYSLGDRLDAERVALVEACRSALIEGEACIFAAVTAGNELLADLAEEEEQCKVQPIQPVVSPISRNRLARKILYSHHIIADSKRAGLRELALSLQVSALVKIGWPGIIVLEGHESRVEAFVSFIQRWRWKRLVVRGEEFIDDQSQKELDELRALPCAFVEFGPHEMSALAQTCRDAGLDELFMRVFKK